MDSKMPARIMQEHEETMQEQEETIQEQEETMELPPTVILSESMQISPR